MAGDRSFAAYITSRFYNDCYLALEGYVEDNKDSLDFSKFEGTNLPSNQ